MTNRAMPGPPWTILSTLQWTSGYFKRHHIDSPRTDAELLMAHSLDCQRLDLYLRYDQPLNEDELADFREFIRRRVNREPVAYIIGHKEFWSLDFNVNQHVLIPRPETEGLVEAALAYLPEHDEEKTIQPKCRVLELGTGSGAVITALAHERPGHGYTATEISVDALKMARNNAQRHLAKDAVEFVLGHWFTPLSVTTSRFDVILSNPPYIPTADITELAPEIHRYEPRMALDGGPDGLRDTIDIIKNAPDFLKAGGVLLLEIGHDQFGALRRFAEDVGVYDRIEVQKDYAGLDRIVHLRTKSNAAGDRGALTVT